LKPYTSNLSLTTVIVIAVIVIASLAGNIYTYQIFSSTVRSLENNVGTFQNQIAALTEALKSYNQTGTGNISLSELYENVKDSIVLIRGQTSLGEISGSGFIYNYSGPTFSGPVIITNYHVVRGTTSRSITLMDGKAYSVRILGSDAYVDLAVLFADDMPSDGFKSLPIVSSSLLNIGDFVIAIGNPYELIGSMTTGIISQLGRAIPEELAGGFSIANVIQISAPLNPGNSGGPLLNSKGQVVGVTFAIIENSTGVGFAIPSDTILREISWLVNNDVYPHSWIGVSGTDVTYEIAQEKGASKTFGWLIVSVSDNGPAKKAGLQPQDIILAINNTMIVNGDDISSYLEEEASPGDVIMITVEREVLFVRSEIILPLELEPRPPPPA
jgi:S1-C subfamily serine protease